MIRNIHTTKGAAKQLNGNTTNNKVNVFKRLSQSFDLNPVVSLNWTELKQYPSTYLRTQSWVSFTTCTRTIRFLHRQFQPGGGVWPKLGRSLIYMRFWFVKVEHQDSYLRNLTKPSVTASKTGTWKRAKRVGWKGATWERSSKRLQASSPAFSAICLPSVDDWDITGYIFFLITKTPFQKQSSRSALSSRTHFAGFCPS